MLEPNWQAKGQQPPNGQAKYQILQEKIIG